MLVSKLIKHYPAEGDEPHQKVRLALTAVEPLARIKHNKDNKVVPLRLEEIIVQTATPPRTKNGRIVPRLWWVGLLTIIASVIANVLVRLLAEATLDISPDFEPLSGYVHVIRLTSLGVLGAIIVFALLARFARRPILMFKRLAAVVLVLSFVPTVWLLVASMPGATGVSVGVLMLMHVAAWAISVGMLTSLALQQTTIN